MQSSVESFPKLLWAGCAMAALSGCVAPLEDGSMTDEKALPLPGEEAIEEPEPYHEGGYPLPAPGASIYTHGDWVDVYPGTDRCVLMAGSVSQFNSRVVGRRLLFTYLGFGRTGGTACAPGTQYLISHIDYDGKMNFAHRRKNNTQRAHVQRVRDGNGIQFESLPPRYYYKFARDQDSLLPGGASCRIREGSWGWLYGFAGPYASGLEPPSSGELTAEENQRLIGVLEYDGEGREGECPDGALVGVRKEALDGIEGCYWSCL